MELDQEVLRGLPQVDALLREPPLAALAAQSPDGAVVRAAREAVAALRERLRGGETTAIDPAALTAGIAARVAALRRAGQRPVINATGVLLHTNLGRAPLGDMVAEEVRRAATQYTTLEYDLETGGRGGRGAEAEAMLCSLAGAEAALAVNNNAAAVLLLLSALAAGREVIVSRGELVEIGGSFRVPEIMAQSGAALVEVGTTNKTRAADYGAAIDEARTAALLKVHASNFKMIGFTEETPLSALAALARARGIPLLYDAGSASFFPLDEYGIHGQLTVAESIGAGADVVCFSGDKLLGGPQAGILVGKKCYIDRLRAHPLARALRLDRLSLTALEATLRLCQSPALAFRRIPVLAMLALTTAELRARGGTLLALLRAGGCPGELSLVETAALSGGGSAPCEELPSVALCVLPRGCSVDALERSLRLGDPPVIARISKGRVLFDLRTVREQELAPLAARLCEAGAL